MMFWYTFVALVRNITPLIVLSLAHYPSLFTIHLAFGFFLLFFLLLLLLLLILTN